MKHNMREVGVMLLGHVCIKNTANQEVLVDPDQSLCSTWF